MRAIVAALAIMGLVACDGVGPEEGERANPAGGYVLEVRADEDVKVFMVTAPDGTSAAGRAADGVSALMDPDEARAFTVLAEAGEPPPEVLSLRVPGFNLSIRAEGDGSGQEAARVQINAGGRQVEIDARDGGAGVTERAHVRITGASQADARDFITDADELSPAVQAEMLSALGLD